MLDYWIIEEIRRRDERRRYERPVLEIPLYPPDLVEDDARSREEEPERGVVVIDFRV